MEGLGSLIGAGWNVADTLTGGALSFMSGSKERKYQEHLMRQQWAREDNAMQRRVADLKAAGLNPILAAGGSGASTTAAHITGSKNTDMSETMAGYLNNTMARTAISKTNAEIDAVNQTTKESKARVKNLDEQNGLLKAQVIGTLTDNQDKIRNLADKIESGVTGQDNAVTRTVKGFLHDIGLGIGPKTNKGSRTALNR